MADYIAGKMSDIFGGASSPRRVRPRPKIRKRKPRPFSRGGYRYMVRIIVPSTRNGTIPVSNAVFMQRVNETRRWLSVFGGYTSVQATGGYVMSEGKHKGKLVKERNAVVTSHADAAKYRMHINKLAGFVRAMKKKWGQESIAVVVETPSRPSETMYFY